MRMRMDRRDAAVQLQKNVLGDLLGHRPIREEVVCDAVDDVLILPDDRGERVVIAALRAEEKAVVSRRLGNCRH